MYLCTMKTIKLHDLYFEPFIEEKEINTIVQSLVKQVKNDCKGETPLFLLVF